jgi:hypothetical protein
MTTKLLDSDLHFVLTRLPKDIRDLMKKHGLILGGGFIREVIAGNKANDIDLFGATIIQLLSATLELQQSRNARKFETPNAITLLSPPRMPVQFIKRWLFPDAAAVVASFDFTVCQAAIWFADGHWHSSISDRFYPDLAARRLVYTSPQREEEAGGSMMRVRKFLARGYSIQASSLGAVIARLVVKVRASDLASTEAGTAQVLSGLLREVDPLLVIDGVDAVEEHQ